MTTTPTDEKLDLIPVLDRMENTVDSMITLLRQETIAVQAIDIPTFTQLQQTKNELFDIYHSDMKCLLGHKEELKSLPDMVKDKIRAWEKSLSIARIDSVATLERAGKSFTRLRDRIVFLAKDSVLRTGARYGADGALLMNTRKAISTGVQDRA